MNVVAVMTVAMGLVLTCQALTFVTALPVTSSTLTSDNVLVNIIMHDQHNYYYDYSIGSFKSLSRSIDVAYKILITATAVINLATYWSQLPQYNNEKYTHAQCTDVDECETNIHHCDENANCFNTEGSYDCTCHDEFIGNGIICLSKYHA